MKLVFRLVAFSLVALVALAACAPNDSARSTPPAPIDPAIVQGKQTNTSDWYPSHDLALVGNTGRPQFLNGFATW